MEKRIENNENCEIINNVNPEETEVLDCVSTEDDYTPSLGESIATFAVLVTTLAIPYVAGVVSADKVKNGIASLKEKHEENKMKRAERRRQLKERRANSKLIIVDDSDEESDED